MREHENESLHCVGLDVLVAQQNLEVPSVVAVFGADDVELGRPVELGPVVDDHPHFYFVVVVNNGIRLLDFQPTNFDYFETLEIQGLFYLLLVLVVEWVRGRDVVVLVPVLLLLRPGHFR